MIIRIIGSIITALIVCLWISSAHGADSPPHSVWDAIYTADQAKIGEASYTQACASCHGDNLDGGGPSPPLAGDDFLASWNGSSVGELFERIQVSMPADRPGSLSKEKNATILAYILQVNHFPAGSRDLPADIEALKGIRIEAKSTK